MHSILALGYLLTSQGTVYIQGSEINLRAKPSARAKIAVKLKIATACEHLADRKGGWVHLRCEGKEGYTKGGLVGPTRPTIEGLKKLIQSEKSAKARLNYALRAATLSPDKKDVLEQLKTAFLEAELESLEKLRREGRTTTETHRLGCGRWQAEECLTKALKKAPAEWTQYKISARGDIVSASFYSNALHVFLGKRGSFKSRTQQLTAYVEFRIDYPQSPPLVLEALRLGATRGKSRADAPLSAKSLNYLARLPERPWSPLQGRKNNRYIQEECFSQVPEIEPRVDLFGFGKLLIGLAQDTDEGTLTEVTYEDGEYTLFATGFMFGDAKTRSLRVALTREGGVLMIDDEPYGAGRGWETRRPAEECGEP